VPDEDEYPNIVVPSSQQKPGEFKPYLRNADKLNRDWVFPGTKGFEHRIGGLEKDAVTGNISHDGLNHQRMVDLRQSKLDRIEDYIPELEVVGDESADILVIGWGGTYGHLYTAVEEANASGTKVALCHFNYINPLPKNTAEILSRFKKIIVCELNMGQFASWLRMKFPQFAYHQYNKVQGLPFTVQELKSQFVKLLEA